MNDNNATIKVFMSEMSGISCSFEIYIFSDIEIKPIKRATSKQIEKQR